MTVMNPAAARPAKLAAINAPLHIVPLISTLSLDGMLPHEWYSSNRRFVCLTAFWPFVNPPYTGANILCD
jgi:hypothetical protein